MIQIKKAFQNLDEVEFKQLLDAPVWMALLAAYKTDGHITLAERQDAIRLAHLRRFTAPKSIREIYEKISQNFPQRLNHLNNRLPSKLEDKIIYIQAQVRVAHGLLQKLDPDIAETIEENLKSYYKHVFNSDKSFFHYFALPVFVNHVEKKTKSKIKTPLSK